LQVRFQEPKILVQIAFRDGVRLPLDVLGYRIKQFVKGRDAPA
jgi:hypothetical protein